MNIFVGNISYRLSNEALQELFVPHGEVRSARIIMDRTTGRSKGFGFVEMPDDQDAQKAISLLHETEVLGRKIIVSQAKPTPKSGESLS
jgi:RNA recognition motif-containing protein